MPGELILIVEDNDQNLKLLRDLLQCKGYKTAEAMTAEEGIKIANSQQPALILMDIQLPGMDGVTALRHLKANPLTQRIPVIAVTASATKSELEQLEAVGFDACQIKPIQIKEFIEVVRKALDSWSATRSIGIEAGEPPLGNVL